MRGWLVRLTSREAVPSAAQWYEISPPGITYVPGGIVDAPRGGRAAVSRQSLGCDFATMDRKARSHESALYGSAIGMPEMQEVVNNEVLMLGFCSFQ